MKILILLYYLTLISVTSLTSIKSTNLQQLGMLSMIRLSMIDLKTEIEKLGIFKNLNIWIKDTFEQWKNSFPTKKVIDVKNLRIETADEKQNSLFEAAHLGNDEAVRRLIALNVNVNAVSKYGATALLIASQEGHDKVIDLLLEHNADIEFTLTNGMNALMLAAKDGHKRTVEVLFKYGVNINAKNVLNISALELAVFYNHKDLVELFVKSYSSEIELQILQTSLTMASMKGNSDIVEILLPYIKEVEIVKNGLLLAFSKHHHSVLKAYFKMYDVNTIEFDGISLLCYASYQGDDVNVKILLRNKANVNKVSSINGVVGTPLFFAVRYGHVSTIKLLLKHEANINYVSEQGLTALFCALLNGTNIVKLLLQHKAEVNIRDKNRYTALHMSVYHGWIEIVEILLKFGADVNALSFGGHSALMLAAFKRFDAILELLIQYKVDIHAKDRFNHNALMFACLAGSYRTVQILLKHGARVNDKSTFGITPLIISEVYEHEDIENLLLENGASAEAIFDFNSSDLASLQQFAKETYNKLGNTPSLKKEKQKLKVLSSVLDNVVEEYFTNNEDTSRQTNDAYEITDYTVSTKDDAQDSTKVISFVSLLLLFSLVIMYYKSYFTKIQIDRHTLHLCVLDFFYTITTTPLLLQNVWGCDKTCQPNESGFFRLLNFRGKLNSSTHVQEVSPNCYGCLVTSVKDVHNLDRHRLYLEHFLLLQYIQKISALLYEAFLITNININEKETQHCRLLYKHALNITADLKSGLGLNEDNNRQMYTKIFKTINTNLRIFSDSERKENIKLKQMYRKKKNQIRITEPQLICSILGLNELFEYYLLELTMESINHQTLVYFLNRWLENTVQAIEETDRSISLYDSMLRIGLSEEKATIYIGYLCEEFINMYSSLYWLSRYFENLCLMNPLITEIAKSCIYEGNFDVWENCEVRRETGDGESLFSIKRLNLKSPSNIYNEEYKSCCNRVKNLRKKCKEEGSIFMYHGTSLTSAADILEFGIDLMKGRPNMDFSHSKGFYLIEDFKMAAKWSGSHKPNNHAVIIFKVKKEEFDNGNGLELSDETEWRNVVRACRKGFRCAGGPQVRERLSTYDYVSGCLCANGTDVQKIDAVPVVLENGTAQPIQTCIVKKEFAKRIGEISNVCGIVIFRAN